MVHIADDIFILELKLKMLLNVALFVKIHFLPLPFSLCKYVIWMYIPLFKEMFTSVIRLIQFCMETNCPIPHPQSFQASSVDWKKLLNSVGGVL